MGVAAWVGKIKPESAGVALQPAKRGGACEVFIE